MIFRTMLVINNVNVESLLETVNQTKVDPGKLKRTSVVIGRWILDEGGPQFSAEVRYEKGFSVIEADQPAFMGGAETSPSPMHYCLFGLASCFTATLTTLAAQEGIELKRLEVAAEGHYDYSRTFGVADKPVVEEIVFKVDADAESKRLNELLRLAEERCPAVSCLTNPIKTSVES